MPGRIVRATDNNPFKANGRENDGRLDLFVLDVSYMMGPPLHVHSKQEDTFYVVDGVLIAQFDDDVSELYPGDFATAPPGVAHTFTNARPDQPARVVNVMTPGVGFQQYIEQINAPGLDPEGVEKLNRDYGVELIGPSLAEKLRLS
jgi:mannose-6-phosphate isomerase-like protein (cupin superfamily)